MKNKFQIPDPLFTRILVIGILFLVTSRFFAVGIQNQSKNLTLGSQRADVDLGLNEYEDEYDYYDSSEDSTEYDNDDPDQEVEDYYEDDDEDTDFIENSNALDLGRDRPNSKPNLNETSRFFRLRRKRKRGRERKRRPRPRSRRPGFLRGRWRKNRPPRGRDAPRPRPGPGQKEPFRLPARQRRPGPEPVTEPPPEKPHGDLVNYGNPIGPFYSDSNQIPLPESPVLLAIYPNKVKSALQLEFKKRQQRRPPNSVPLLTSTTTTKRPDPEPTRAPATRAPERPQSLSQTFNIAIPAPQQVAQQVQPIVITAPREQRNSAPATETRLSINAYYGNGGGYQQQSRPAQAQTQYQPAQAQTQNQWQARTPSYAQPQSLSAIGNPHPYQAYAQPAPASTNNNCAQMPSASWTPWNQNGAGTGAGAAGGSHYYGRRIGIAQNKPYCQPSNSAGWTTSAQNQYRNVPESITRYYPNAFRPEISPTSSKSQFTITPSVSYQIPQNIYESYRPTQPSPFQTQTSNSNYNRQNTNYLTATSNGNNQNSQNSNYYLEPSSSSGQNLQNSNYSPASSGGYNQNQQNSNYSPAPSSGQNPQPTSNSVSQDLQAPVEAHNYLTFKNNQQSSLDYEFPVSDEQADENLPADSTTRRPSRKPKRKRKRRRRPKVRELVPDVLNAVKNDLGVLPVRLLNGLFPKVVVSQTSKGGRDVEFTIGK